MNTTEINNMQDIIDSRDIIERIDELENLDERDDEELVELTILRKLAEQCDGCGDWEYGEQLIRGTYFVQYCQELAEDIGAIDKNATWPNTCIDWEKAADELKYDYNLVDWDGVDYWIRC